MADWINHNPLPALVLVITALLLCVRRLLASAQVVYAATNRPLAQRIDALLPQTQCGHCGYPGCKPYAEAIANGDAFNKCLPGGEPTVRNLATLLERDVIALDAPPPPPLSYAFIREAECIGCTKCIQACPVDAILGAAKQMHTVIRDECTGCDLCVEPCPVDCIEMRPFVAEPVSPQLIASDRGYDARDHALVTKADHYRARFEAHQARIAREQQEKEQKRRERTTASAVDTDNAAGTTTAADDKLAIIAAALARTQARKAAQQPAAPVATTRSDDPQQKRARELAAIDKRLESTQQKLQQAIADNATDKIAALQTALQTLQQKRAAVDAPTTPPEPAP